MKGLVCKLISLIITLAFVASCSNKTIENDGVEYIVLGSIECADSAEEILSLNLYIDHHGAFLTENISVTNGRFEYKGKTVDADELFFTAEGRQIAKVIAQGGSQIEIAIKTDGSVSFVEKDSLNTIYQNILANMDSISEAECNALLDSICKKYRNSILSSLVFRDRMHLVSDSLFLRQCFGHIASQAKPEWIVSSIEKAFDRGRLKQKKNLRLFPLPKLRTDLDSIVFDFKDARPNSALLYFWADYNKPSVDSLKILDPLAKNFGLESYLFKFKTKENHRPKRVDIVTICLSAADSTSWLETVKNVPGRHILLQDGFSSPCIKGWNISRIPYNMIIDRYSNIQESFLWGKDLYEAMERQPNNFTYITNDSKNNISSPPRH